MNGSRPALRVAIALLLVTTAATTATRCLRPLPAAASAAPATQLVSTSATGTLSSGPSAYPALSFDGRFIAFSSDAANLVAGDGNGLGDVFVKDTLNGALVCASLSPAGGPSTGESYAVSIGGDGTRVVFASEAPDLVTGDVNQLADVFLRDLATGMTTRLSRGSAEPDGPSSAPRISSDGQFVVFASDATNLVNGDANGLRDVFVRSIASGTIERISQGPSGESGDGPSEAAAVSADGRYVVFASQARNLIAGEDPSQVPSSWDVYRRDRQAGTTVRVSVNLAGAKGNGASYAPVVSGDGRCVAFASRASDLVQSDLDGTADVFVRDLVAGTTVRASLGAGNMEPDGSSTRPSISADGRLVAFESSATNLVTGFAPSGSTCCYLRNLASGTTAFVVLASPEPSVDGGTVSPAISGDGHWVAFSSADPALVGGDSNEQEDVFVRGPLP